MCIYIVAFMPYHASWIASETTTVMLMKGNNSCVSVNNVCLAWAMSHSFCVYLCVCVCPLDMNLNLRQAARHHLCTRGNEFSAFMAVEQA